jgi:hypothetical protein
MDKDFSEISENNLDRTVPFDEKAICDGCKASGAYDFMGDYICQNCLDKMNWEG